MRIEQHHRQFDIFSKSLQKLQIVKVNSKLLHLLYFILLINLANGQCFDSQADSTQSSCLICLNNNIYVNCSYSFNSKSVQFVNQSYCSMYCCSFDYSQSIYFCNSNNQSSSSNTDTTGTDPLKLSSILIIVFFSVLVTICFCIIICSCLRRNNNNRTLSADANNPPLSAVNLQNFNRDDIGPLYQDKKQNCSICLQQKCNIRTKCGHPYHHQCLYDWIHKRQSCPLCVGRDFNPIIVYCKKCFVSVKLVGLMQNMDQQAQRSWQTIDQIRCECCLGYRAATYEVSINLSAQIAESQPQQQDKDKVKIQTNQSLMR